MIEVFSILLLAGIGLLVIGYIFVRILILIVYKKSIKVPNRYVKVLMYAVNGVSILIVVFATMTYVSSLMASSEELAVDIRYGHFYRHMVAGNLDQAYKMMTPKYQNTHSIEEFSEEYSFVPDYNPFPGRYLNIEGRKATYYPGYDHWPMSGPVYDWIKTGGDWRLSGFTWSYD